MIYFRNIRKKLNKSQQEIADELGVTQKAVSRYENGKTLISVEYLKEYAIRFNISTDYLLGRIDEKLPIKKEVTN